MADAENLDSLTEEMAARLIDRAAKLDAQGGRVPVDELREVALEAGISAESFERALAEISAPEVGATLAVAHDDGATRPPTVGRRVAGSLVSTLLQRAGIFVAGSALAFLSSTLISDIGMDDEPVVIFSLVVAALIASWSAITRRRDRKVLDFEVDLGVLWFAMTFFFMLTNPGDAGNVLEVMMPAGFLASLMGGFFVATGPSEPQPAHLPERV